MLINSATRNNYYPKKSLQTRQAKPSDVSFGSGILTIALASGAILTLLNGINAKPMLENNKDSIVKTSGWQPNVRVIAPAGQNVITYATDSIEYASRLFEQLDSANTSTIEEANAALAKNGYKVECSSKDKGILSTTKSFVTGDLFFDKLAQNKTYHSLETPGAQLGIFNKKKQNKDRFVVIFHNENTPLASNICAKFYRKIRNEYKIDSKNIIYLGISSNADFQQGIDSVSQKIDSLKDKSNAELLVFYAGHGTADATNDSAKKLKGQWKVA